jgi:AMIN domain
MVFPRNFSGILFAAVVVSAAAQTPRVGAVGRISILNENPLQIQVQTTEAAVPQVQMVSSPERLVIDIPNTVPGASLHGLTVNRGDVRGVRVSQYSVRPRVTRVVVDLNSPQWYRVVPNGVGLVISLGSDRATADASQPAIGWVSSTTRGTHPAPVVLMRAVSTQAQRINGVNVVFSRGLLTIHAQNATLSEILFQIQKQTGAEIAIPAGTEQDRVAADFGPGTPSAVMGDLLNGSGLNFVVVGSASDPNQLRSVILSRKTGGVDPPGAFQAADNPPPQAVSVMEPSNVESSGPPPDNPPQPNPMNDPPPDQVPN